MTAFFDYPQWTDHHTRMQGAGAMKEFFPGIGKIPYEGPKTKKKLAFRCYNPEEKVGKKTMVDWLLPYLGEKDRKWVEARKADLRIEYLDYDWSLNGK